MNELKIQTQRAVYTFSDADGTLYQGATAATYFSPLGNELRAHEYKIPIVYTPRKYQIDASEFAADVLTGYTGELYQGGAMVRMFFVTSVSGGKKLRGGRYLYYIRGTDFAGRIMGRIHKGGVYTNSTVGAVIREILGAVWPTLNDPTTGTKLIIATPSVYISDEVYNTAVNGWLPYTEDARENLRYLLQIANARISWSGGPSLLGRNVLSYISANHSGVPIEISPYNTYDGDEYLGREDVGEVVVNEYSYLALDNPVETIFETSTAVTDYLVKFDKPMHTVLWNGSAPSDYGANYAVVSGTGTLTGKPYTVTTRKLSQTIGGGNSKAAKTLDNPIVGPLNSAAMLERMENYYENAIPLQTAFVAPDTAEAGSFFRVEDPLGDTVQGYPTELTLTFSGKTKASGDMVVGWTPISGSVFTEEHVFDASGTLTVPSGVTLLRLILIQGGTGGQAGHNGQNAYRQSTSDTDYQSGDGGAVGNGGSAGKVYQIDLESSDIAASYTIVVGAAGSPGATNGAAGTAGTHSTATAGGTTYTSDSGAVPDGGILDPMTGEVLAVTGQAGIYPGQPGLGPNHYGPYEITDAQTGVTGTTTWRNGDRGLAQDGGILGGGGPAYGSNGQNATRNRSGAGADAVLDGINGYTVKVGSYGSGGIGGNGGGGGGGSTAGSGSGHGGSSGGAGSPGGPAAQGAVIALFAYGDTPQPVPTPNYLFDSNNQPLYDYDYERLIAQEE